MSICLVTVVNAKVGAATITCVPVSASVLVPTSPIARITLTATPPVTAGAVIVTLVAPPGAVIGVENRRND